MTPGELIARLTPQQRMDMIMKGYRPGDIKDVQRYIKSQGQPLSLKEKEEKIKVLTGGFKDLGSASDREIYLDSSRGNIPLDEIEQKYNFTAKRTTEDYRDMMNEEMSYSSKSINQERIFNTDDILSFGGNKKQKITESNKNLRMIANEGFNNAKEYLNGFVLNLQNEDPSKSYNLRLNIFKSLKKCLEAEGNYKNDPQAIQAYRQGVIKAEKALLEKLQG